MDLDSTLDYIDQNRFFNKTATLRKQILQKTHFNAVELDAILLIYYKLQRDGGERSQALSRRQFRSIFYICFDIADDFLMDRIMVALDRGTTPHVTPETWALTLSMFLRGTLHEKSEYCFAVYDIVGEGLIRRDHIISLMRKSVYKHHEEDLDEAVKDLVDILIKRMDIDQDGSISYKDFMQSVARTPQLLECFGQCLPDRGSICTFLTTFADKINRF